jgi:enamine deaminase RidA (YjgF/YER057c/UK114 family)
MPATNGIAHSSFSGARGGTEHFIAVTAPPEASFEEQITSIGKRYRETVRSLGLEPETAAFRRLFVSDVMNQAGRLTQTELASDAADGPVAVSIVQQPPLPGGKVSMLAYHIDSPEPVTKWRLSKRHVVVEKNGLRHLWSTRLCASDDHGAFTAEDQTQQVFDDLIGTLKGQGGTLRDDCVRTWIYVKDVDVFYQEMVDSRRELFARHGMNGNSHYIASTGIEGACAHRHDLVAMDAYSVLGLQREQVSYLNDFDRLCLTRDYNVTFERGTRIAYADRSHYFISGTASIDRNGQVVHRGNVMRQLDRALDNVDALLLAGDASLEDMKYLIVYLRDPSDHARIKQYLAFHLPDVPVFIVEGAVCRPEWLVEVEGVAVAPNEKPGLPVF